MSVNTDAAGGWSYTPTVPLADGARTVVVTGTDGVGNLTSRSRSFTVDTTATVSISAPAQGSTIAQRRPTVTGTSDLLSDQLSLVLDGLGAVTLSTEASGDWSYPIPADLVDGAHTVLVTGTDPVGNSATDTVTFSVDGTGPVLTVDSPADGATIADPSPTISGTSDQPNSTVSLQIDAQPGVSVSTNATGGWTYTPADLADGAHTVTVTATDGLGNLGTDSSIFTIDTHAEITIDDPAEGATTAQPRPGITGRSDILDSSVTVTLDGVPASVSTGSTGAWSFTPGADLSEGPHTVTVAGSDAAGNPASATATFTVDTTAPQVAIVTPADGSSSNVVQPSIAGTSDLPSATLHLAIDGAAPASVTTAPDGTWSYPTPAPLAEGDHTVAVTGADPAGNVGGDVSTFTIDTTDPSVTIGIPAQGAQVGEATPMISGTSADADGTVQLRIDGGGPITVGTAPDGGWTTTSAPLLDGPHTVTASVTDVAGNTASATHSFTVAATAPAVQISDPVDGSDIADASPQINGGSNVAAGQVSVRIDGGAPVLVPTDGSGDWSHQAPLLADGPHTVVVSVTTPAGTDTDQISFTVDTHASLSIASPAEGSLLATATPQLRGGSDAPNSTVRLVVDAGPAVTVPTDNIGDWAWTPPAPGLADGDHTITGSVSDVAGNTAGATLHLTIDTTAPAVSIDDPAEGSVIADPAPVIRGRSDLTNGTVTLAVDGAPPIDVATDASGAWTHPLTGLTDGPHTVAVTAVDPAGNTGTAVSGFVVDTQAPEVAISSPADGAFVPSARPAITGTSDQPSSTLLLRLDGAAPVGVATSAAGNWSFTPATDLTEDAHTVSVSASDTAGNTTTATSGFTVDTTPPSITIATPADGSSLNDPSPQVQGGSDLPDATLLLAIDGAPAVSVPSDATGDWTWTPATDLGQGPHLIVVTGQDDAGNSASASTGFTVDTLAPTVQILTPPDGSTSNDPTPRIAGSSDLPNGQLRLAVDGGAAVTVPSDAAGDWSLDWATALSAGPHTITATLADAAGNLGTDSSGFTLDLTAPEIQIQTPSAGAVLADPTPSVTGSSAGSTGQIQLSLDGAAPGPLSAAPSGGWTWTPGAPLAQGPHTVRVTTADAAGNTADDAVSFSVDSIAPELAITAPSDGALLGEATPTITGTSDLVNGSVTLAIDGSPAVTVSTDGTGGWSFTPAALADGQHTVVVTAVDAAGNTASASTTFRTDTVAPVVGILRPPAGAVLRDPTPSFLGSSDVLEGDLRLSVDGGPAVLIDTDSAGGWTWTPTFDLADGPHTVSISGTDQAGNIGTATTTFTIDTAAPAVSISTPVDGATGNDPTPGYSGSSELANSTVRLRVDSQSPVLITTDAAGDWSYVPTEPLADGPHTAIVAGTDQAGNVGTDQSAFTVDTTGPAVAIVAPANGSSTNDTTPPVIGTAAGSTGTLTLSLDGASTNVEVDGAGAWSWTPAVDLGAGPHTVSVTGADALGNSATAASTFTVDLTAPTITIRTPSNGAELESQTPTVTGGSDLPGGTVDLLLDGAPWASVTTDSRGSWYYQPTTGLSPGSHTLLARIADPAGNLATATVTFVVLEPLSVDISFPAPGSELNDRTPDITGTAQAPDSRVSVQVDGGTPVVAQSGQGVQAVGLAATQMPGWALTLSPLADGQHTVTATVADSHGRTRSDSTTFLLDTVAPRMAITAPTDGSAVTGARPLVTGTSDVLSGTITLSVDGGASTSVATDASGAWSHQVTSTLNLGSHTVYVSASDTAGNKGSATSTFTVRSLSTGTTGGTGSTNTGSTNTGSAASTGTGSLAHTGADVAGRVGISLLLLAGGALLVNRRRLGGR